MRDNDRYQSQSRNCLGRGLRAVCGLPEGTCGPGTGASSFCRTAARQEAKHRAVHLFPAPPSTHADKEHKMPAAAAAAETAQEEVAPGHVRIPPRSGRREAGSRAGSLTWRHSSCAEPQPHVCEMGRTTSVSLSTGGPEDWVQITAAKLQAKCWA